MYHNKVVICGVNTAKLKTLTDEEKKDLLIKAKNGDVISIRKTDVNVPLETLEYAINLRIGKAEKQ